MAWLVHPMTLALGGLLVAALLFVVELLVSSLARLGNVRFQGVLEDHEGALPWVADRHIHLSKVTDILRWIEVACFAMLWLVIARFPWTAGWHAVTASAACSGLLVLLTRGLVGTLAEDTVARLMRLVSPVAGPLIRLFPPNGDGQQPAPTAELDEEEASEREIQAILEAGQAAGIFEGEEGEFVESLVDFFDTVVREVMTPRTEMVTAADTASFDELLQLFAQSLKSRIPVFHETVDKVVATSSRTTSRWRSWSTSTAGPRGWSRSRTSSRRSSARSRTSTTRCSLRSGRRSRRESSGCRDARRSRLSERSSHWS